jgi:hypothetical protein
VVPLDPEHLPKCPIDPERYDRLYAFNQGLDDQMPGSVVWQEVRVKPGMPELDVYRMLPSAPDYEYSGYLTKSRIRYFKGDAFSTGMLMSKACTFHSHPTKNPFLADVPSLKDIYSFLTYRHLRSITVGATKTWVYDKTRATLGTVRRLADWMQANHFRVITRLMKKDFSSWPERYVEEVMKSLGWVWPDSFDEMHEEWPRMLRENFKIKVRIFPRDLGVAAT